MLKVIKRRGKEEPFEETKAYASIYAACIGCALGEKKSDEIARSITKELIQFLKGKKDVNSTMIFGFVVQRLAAINEPAAFMYETHRELRTRQ